MSSFESQRKNNLIIIHMGTSFGHLFLFLNKVSERIRKVSIRYNESHPKVCSKFFKSLLRLLYTYATDAIEQIHIQHQKLLVSFETVTQRHLLPSYLQECLPFATALQR